MCSLRHPLRKGGISFQRRADRVEIGLGGRAHARHRTDDRKRNAGRDQTIFNRGRPRLIRKELRDLPPQNDLLQGLRRFYPAVHVYI
jgi:hypothetical protein